MSSYLISYDLIKEKDYEKIYDAIKSFGTWARVTESVWIVVSDLSCSELRDKLSEYMDNDDRLFVLKSSGIAAWRNVRCRNEWLKTYL
ncbi:TPA: CRISPR-associated endonuclease Cas2 [Proteus mirabilis]|uniref:CRISPR-associated endonuclease Cas2 n=1 Tax=Proteus mirabilis TaxID=584 RepID=UPI0029E58ACE|nr:CRISPR-associated endonuclease Cas2 [Proteus mirabilis]HEK0979883.1 CRISPR-associated endonuclease Cas2 [Proteus mirabilis]HEK1091642.1 CRISPR-associated endonuclease Cas2 [Proteus mirabilis]HEK1885579.1 CRISPR-associated endonuclease Cas2 [Proteus mirabilis]HEK1906424.1 CRISPR-associated endonuclease Cas2 [Proteus mirabilis]